MRISLLFVVCIALFFAEAVQAGDWPQFRGPGGSGVSEERNLPDQWDATNGIRWKAELPGRGLSCPVIAGGRVYVTASSGYRENRLHVLCFDAATGRKLWERRIAATGDTNCNPKTCMAAPTPVTDGKNVYALFATADVVAFDADGNLRWYRSLVKDYPNISNQVGMAASPILYKDSLIVPMENAVDSFVLALDAKTGKNKWKLDRERAVTWPTPLLAPVGPKGRLDLLLLSPTDVAAVDPETGQKHWTYNPQTADTIPSIVVGEGLVFAPRHPLLALKPSGDDQTPDVVWKSAPNFASGFPSPLFYKGRLYGMTQTGVTCLDAANGKELWRERVEGPFAASPVIADGKLYIVNEKGTAFVFSLGDKPELLSKNVLNDPVLATPAFANGAIYLRSDGWLYCIGSKK